MPTYQAKNKYNICFALFLLIIYPLFAMVNIYYVSLETNILYTGEVYTTVLSFLCTLADTAIFFTSFAVFMYAAYRWTLRGSVTVILIHSIGLLYKYAMNLLVAYLFDGFPSNSQSFAEDLWSVGMNVLLELFEFAVVIWIVGLVTEKYHRNRKAADVYSRHIPDYNTNDRFQVFPYRKLFDQKNPILTSVLYVTVAHLVIRFANIAVGEIAMSVQMGFLPNTLADWLYLVGEVLYEVLLAVGGYVYMRWLIGRINARTEEEKTV